MKIGDLVYINGGSDNPKIPLIVTHIHGGGKISGVAFSGHPHTCGYSNSGTQPLQHLDKGEGWHEWQPIPARVVRKKKPADES